MVIERAVAVACVGIPELDEPVAAGGGDLWFAGHVGRGGFG